MQPNLVSVTNSALRIGVDIGGTFTDFVIYDPDTGALETFKLVSTPDNPAEAVLQGLALIRRSSGVPDKRRACDIIHGSTVATNALLERKGARTAFVTTSGFSDLLQIGRQNRPALYDFFSQPAPVLVPPELRFEIDERLDYQGQVLQSLDIAQVEQLVPELHSLAAESVAVCLLFSFVQPKHEEAVVRVLRRAGFLISASNEILPEFREYERASTTTVNAYVSPVLERYLSQLDQAMQADGGVTRLRVMQSNGGNISLDEARQGGVRCILSGPAGGVVGAGYVGKLAQALTIGLELPDRRECASWESQDGGLRMITFDMGGTSTDVSLIDGEPRFTTEAEVSGCPIHLPLLDIHTIGAGGGSIARVDAGGALRVGPESAGAIPGPACYGRGDYPTVTDANLVLGRLAADEFLGGQMRLDVARASQALARLGENLGMDPIRAALGVVQVANAHMERALRVISVERGHDPRRFTLLSFGGAGGLHAADLARRLGIARVLIPPLASTLSAFGMLTADIIKDYSLTVMLPGETSLEILEKQFQWMAERGEREVRQAGAGSAAGDPGEVEIERQVDMRYRGQSYELTIPFSNNLLADFHACHLRAYGYARAESEVELVNLRVRAIQRASPPSLSQRTYGDADPGQALLGLRNLISSESPSPVMAPFYRGEQLQPGNRLVGPAIVLRSDTTIMIGSQDSGLVDAYGNLWIRVGAS